VRVAIIGGGISGLSAAHTREQARRNGVDVEYVLFEATERLGGALRTEMVEGCVVEAGPDSFLTEKDWALDFCRQLGLGDQLISSQDAQRKSYILVRGRLVPIPDGLQFMVPTRILPVLFTPLFSWSTKLRMAREYFYRPNSPHRDETVAAMVERHFGPEVVERLADPLLSGVYGGDVARLSARAVLPRFVQMEAKYGSFSRGMLAARRRQSAKAATPPPLFTTLRDGMQRIADTIVAQLQPGSVRTSAAVRELALADGQWIVVPQHAAPERFHHVIVALSAPTAGAMLEKLSPELARELQGIAYSSSVTVTLGYNRSDLAALPAGFGFLVPHSEGKRMLACTFVHNKFPHRGNQEIGLIRCFLGGTRDEAILDASDQEILRVVKEELRETVKLQAVPRFERVYRWRGAMAQYETGHLERIARIDRLRTQLPGLALAGNAYRGIGVPDCIASGIAAADMVLQQMAPQARAQRSQDATTPQVPG
jgi:oxygen-dependent protoporphyrinogen oxidase